MKIIGTPYNPDLNPVRNGYFPQFPLTMGKEYPTMTNRKSHGSDASTDHDHPDTLESGIGGTGSPSPAPSFDGASIEGVEVLSFISMAQLVAGRQTMEKMTTWAAKAGKGARISIGQLIGYATKAESKTNLIDGQETESIELTGEFEAVIFETGEVLTAPTAYLPKMWGQQVFNLLSGLKDDPGARANMILTLGAESVVGAKGVPYRWTVKTKISNQSPAMLELKQQAARLAQAQLAGDRNRRLSIEGEPATENHAQAAD